MSNLCHETAVQSHTVMPSSILPIDATSKTLSRMASIRRSLIPVDFFSRRKKKDRRRNTIAECETKSSNGTTLPIQLIPPHIINGSTNNFSNRIITNISHLPLQSDINHVPLPDTPSEENNNTCKNSSPVNVDNSLSDTLNSNDNCKEEMAPEAIVESAESNSSSMPKEQKTNQIVTDKKRKKSKSHLPISTSSAAMAIAVKMRQTYVKDVDDVDENRSSSGNWSGSSSTGRDSSDSEDTKSQVIGQISRDSLLTKNCLQRLTENLKITESLCNSDYCPSSAGDTAEPKTSVSSDGVNSTFSMHTSVSEKDCLDSKNSEYSFESDDDVENENMIQYSSGLSLSCESINSLLSRTGGNELSTSTDTLLSNCSRIPIAQPPMPFSGIPHNSNENTITSTVIPQPLDFSPRKRSIYRETGKVLPVVSNRITKNQHKSFSNDLSKTEDTKASKISNIIQKKFKFKENSQGKSNKHIDKRKFDRIENRQRPINMYSEDAVISRTVKSVIHDSKITPESSKANLNTFRPNIHTSGENFSANTFSSPYNSELSHVISNNPRFPESEKPCEVAQLGYNQFENSLTYNPMPYSQETTIPNKYSHQITVTPLKHADVPYPVLGYDQLRQMECSMCCKCAENFRSRAMPRPLNNNSPKENRPISYQDYSPVYDQQPQQSIAHVVLNPDGNVVYSTSSLDRRLYNGKSSISQNVQQDRMYSTLDTRYNGSYQHSPNHEYYNNYYSQQNIDGQNTVPTSIKIQETKLLADNSVYSCYHNSEPFLQYPVNANTPTNIPITTSAHEISDNLSQYTSSKYQSIPQACNSRPKSANVVRSQQIVSSIDAQRSRDDSTLSTFRFNQFSDHLQFLKSKDHSPKSPTMTTDDLFAIIHDSKKRLNIRTDSDIVTPSSSGSVSPSFQSFSAKNGPAETGFLGQRNSFGHTNNIGDRRSWADFRGASERRSLASDRMGPNKPTSLHDFKMLLMQTRSNQDGTRHQKSAVEQLRVNPPSKCVTNSDQLSNSLQSSPVTPLPAYDLYNNGHMTVPLKRNARTKMGIQPRCIVYPPILEDCSEDVENTKSDKKKSVILESTNSDSTEYTCRVVTNKNSDPAHTQIAWQYGNTSMWV